MRRFANCCSDRASGPPAFGRHPAIRRMRRMQPFRMRCAMTNRRRRSGFRRRRFFQWRAPGHPARRSPRRGLRRFCFNRRRCGRRCIAAIATTTPVASGIDAGNACSHRATRCASERVHPRHGGIRARRRPMRRARDRARNQPGPLHGVPVAVRDIFNTKGRVILQACTLCASRIIGAKRCRFAAHSF